jgi:hypothetical protein
MFIISKTVQAALRYFIMQLPTCSKHDDDNIIELNNQWKNVYNFGSYYICDVAHSPLSTTKVKKVRSNASTPPYALMAWWFTEHRNKVTFTFWCRIHLWFRYVGGFVRKVDDVTAYLAAQPSRLRAHHRNKLSLRVYCCCCRCILHFQQYSRRLNLLRFFINGIRYLIIITKSFTFLNNIGQYL